MKIFMGSLTDFSVEVDAWVPTHEQGLTLLKSLASYHEDHVLILRARFQRYQNYEERYIGTPEGEKFDAFIKRVEHMGSDEPTEGDES